MPRGTGAVHPAVEGRCGKSPAAQVLGSQRAEQLGTVPSCAPAAAVPCPVRHACLTVPGERPPSSPSCSEAWGPSHTRHLSQGRTPDLSAAGTARPAPGRGQATLSSRCSPSLTMTGKLS